MQGIVHLKEERKQLTAERKLFEQRICSKCEHDISTFPTLYFMCGHVFHESCSQEVENQKVCVICYPEYKDSKITGQWKESDFDNELAQEEKKMKPIARYFGKGLFSDIQNEMSHHGI